MAVKLAVVGGGNMGGTIVLRALRPPDAPRIRVGQEPELKVGAREIIVCDTNEERRRGFELLGIETTNSIADAVSVLDPVDGHVLLAVKPQSFPDVAAQLRTCLRSANGVISIMAGVPIIRIAAMLGRDTGIIRAMPNLAVKVRSGITALALGPEVTASQAAFVVGLFGSLGTTINIDEHLMDAFTALAGSGPAYLFYVAEAMVRAGESLGFDAATADQTVRSTIFGAAMLLASGEPSPAELRAAVTSKGGTTEAAIKVLDDRDVIGAFVEAITRARDRGRELAE